MKNKIHQLFLVVLVNSVIQTSAAGIVISSKHHEITETSIYQKGIAIYLKDGKANSIIDTNTNNCIVINHALKRYLFLKCNEYRVIVKKNILKENKKFEKTTPIAVQEMMTGNQPPKTPITIKRSGRGSYQGFHIEKYQFVVDDEVVSEYWMSSVLKEKIDQEIDISKLDSIRKVSNKNFSNGLNATIDKKYDVFKKHQYALKEFRYTGSGTRKIYRHVTMKRVKIRKYMPPKTYKISASISEFLKEDTEL